MILIKKYLGEIIIDGYTDTDGDYSYNLELSQKRSLAVAQYLLDIKKRVFEGCTGSGITGLSRLMDIPCRIRFWMRMEK